VVTKIIRQLQLPLGSAAPVGCHPIAFEHAFASCGERPTEPDQRHSVGRRSARPGNADSRAPTSRPACRPTTSPRRSRDRGAGHVNVCPPQFVLPGTPRSARYVRSNHPVRRHRLQQVRALERLSIEIGCGLSFGEAATFCRPSAPADTICRPSAPADTAIRGGFRCSCNAGVGVVLLFSTSWQVLLITLMSGCLLDRLRPGFDLDVIDGLCRASASGTRGRILIHCRFAPARRRTAAWPRCGR
jgi:hypothetical protein